LRAGRTEFIVVAADELREDLVDAFGKTTPVTIAPPLEWLQRNGTERDLVVVPGGRNGALTTGRVVRQAALLGATVVVVADRESVGSTDIAAEGLGLVTTRRTTPD